MTIEYRQLLPKTAYSDPDWFERERRELFDESWVYACLETDVANPGDFVTLRFIDHALLIVRGPGGELEAFHNICRHRGCEVLEGRGNTGGAMVCPYHRWSYRLDGSLRGVPNEAACFDALPRESLGLVRASVGRHRGVVYVNPSAAPRDPFDTWIAGLDAHAWPHRFDDGSMRFSGEVVYEMHCNWKVFYENAIDGYHLGYLHDRTLGPVYPDRNVWDRAGRHHLWYSTERGGQRRSNTLLTAQIADQHGSARLHSDDAAAYPGVVMLFPLTILSPSPWGFYISVLEPKGPESTLLRTQAWSPGGDGGRFRLDAERRAPLRLVDIEGDPRDSGNFQIEDMWIVEKIQRNLHSPHYRVGPLARGRGAEEPIVEFQREVLDFVPLPEAAG